MTDDTKCVCCHRRDPADGLTTCAPCLGRLDDDLARIVELVALAATWLHPRSGSSGVRSVPASRPPVDLASLDAAIGNDVLPLLESWERMVREWYGLGAYGPASRARNAALAVEQYRAGVPGPPATVKGCAGFLRAWLFRIAETADFPVDDLAREARDCRWQLERLDPDHDRPDGIRVACTSAHPDHDGRECGNRLVIDGTMLTQDVECRRCGNVTTGGRMILSALNDPAVTVWAYPDVIEATLGIKAATLRQWHARGHIKRSGNRYDVGEAFRRRHYIAGTA